MKASAIVLTFLTVAMSASAVHADCLYGEPTLYPCNGTTTYAWDGTGGDANWTTTDNWDANGVPPYASGSAVVDIDAATVTAAMGTQYIATWDGTASGEFCQVNVTADALNAMRLDISDTDAFFTSNLNLTGVTGFTNRVATLEIDFSNFRSVLTTVKSYAQIDIEAGDSVEMGWMTIDADAANADSRLEVIVDGESTGTLNAEALTIRANNADNQEAEFLVNHAQLVVNIKFLRMIGDDGDTRDAIFNFDLGTVNAINCAEASGMVDFQLAQDLTISGLFSVVPEATPTFDTDVVINATHNSKTFRVGSMDIEGGDDSGESTLVNITEGHFTSDGLIKLLQGTDSTNFATLQIGSGADTISIHSVEQDNETTFQVDKTGDVVITNEYRVLNSGANSNEPNLTLAASVDLRAGSFVLGPNVTFAPVFGGSGETLATFGTYTP